VSPRAVWWFAAVSVACAPRAPQGLDPALADDAERLAEAPPRAILEEAASSDDPTLRAIAMLALAPDDPSWLGRALFDPHPWVQLAAANSLSPDADLALGTSFIQADTDPVARATLIHRWGPLAEEAARVAWARATTADRLALAPAVWRSEPEAIPLFAAAAARADLRIPGESWRLAGSNGAPDWRAAAAAGLESAEDENRLDLTYCAAGLGDGPSRAALLALVRDPDWREALLQVSGNVDNPLDRAVLSGLATGDDGVALRARATLKQASAQEITSALDADDPFRRADGATAAASLPRERARSLLSRRSADPSPVVRLAVARAIATIGPQGFSATLGTMLSDPTAEVRVRAASMLLAPNPEGDR
jgi:hypothetical protein